MDSASNEKNVKRKKRRRNMPLVRDDVAIAAKLEMLKAVDDRRYQVAKLYIGGKRQADIARALNVQVDIVRKDLDIIRKEWIRLSSEELLQLRADECARLLHLQAEAWERYWQSCQPRAIKKAVRTGPGVTVTAVVTHKRDGDPRWMRIVIDCIKARCQILGLIAQRCEQDVGYVMNNPHTLILERLNCDQNSGQLAGIRQEPDKGEETRDVVAVAAAAAGAPNLCITPAGDAGDAGDVSGQPV